MSCLVLSFLLSCRKVLYLSCVGKHGARYKTNFISLKAVLTFQTFMLATLANLPQLTTGLFSWQELLLDFAAWIDPTSNAHNLLISVEFEVTEHILLLQNVLTTYGLSRLYDASQPPGRLQGTLKQCLRYYSTEL